LAKKWYSVPPGYMEQIEFTTLVITLNYRILKPLILLNVTMALKAFLL